VNCCDDFGRCTRGPGCPAGEPCPHCRGLGYDASGYTCTCVKPAEVAKVGRKYQDRDPLPASPWRAYLRHLAWAMLLVVAVTLVSGLTVGLLDRQKAAESQCQALVKEWQAVGVPKHIKIKCGEYL
jgi:hypothetical protein